MTGRDAKPAFEAHSFLRAARQLGRPGWAAQCLHESLAVLRAVNARPDQVVTLSNVGLAYGRLAQYEESFRHYRQALQFAVGIGLRFEQARAHHGLGRCAAHEGDSEAAARHLQQESTIRQDLGVPAGSMD
ncbi:tetratricopeptide repeat protein [Kribbella sindirgiensis]|uniref:tetratricopeptide repeat protein n=1 Tax=Kribbella sindirgiensis TaxID=1124744 RepID=UPI0013F3EAB0|nr:tetratricopeptide repeat protein [Kribbella sindirgiensis]